MTIHAKKKSKVSLSYFPLLFPNAVISFIISRELQIFCHISNSLI